MIPVIIRHPVMGWFCIILLATIVMIPPLYVLVSPRAAIIGSIIGQLLAMNWAVANVFVDIRRRRRR